MLPASWGIRLILWLIKEKVGGQFFVLIACKVRLDSLIAGKAKTA